jgi:NADH-quinone oxidoreductase subunit M
VILAAAYLLWLYQRVFFGPVNNPKNEHLRDLSAREIATFVPLVALAFWIGLYPKPFFQILATPVNNLVATVRPDYPGLQKPVVAGQPPTTTQPEVTAPAAAQPKAPEAKAPSGANQSAPGTEQGQPATTQAKLAATTAGGK